MRQIAWLCVVAALSFAACQSEKPAGDPAGGDGVPAPGEEIPGEPFEGGDEGAFELSMPVSGAVASFDGGTVAYSRYGEHERAVVLLHCWACDQSFWDNQLFELGQENTVVTLDLPGHGLSQTEREQWSNPNYGRDVEAVVKALDLNNVVLVGHSMGGAVAVEAARLLGDRVVGIVPVDTLHDFDFDWSKTGWEKTLEALGKDFAGGCPQFVGSMFVESSPVEVIQDVQQRMCGSIDPEIGMALLRSFPDHDIVSAIRELEVPMRAVNGASFPTDADGNREIADFGVAVIQDIGHFPMLEDPERFNGILMQVIEDLYAEASSS